MKSETVRARVRVRRLRNQGNSITQCARMCKMDPKTASGIIDRPDTPRVNTPRTYRLRAGENQAGKRSSLNGLSQEDYSSKRIPHESGLNVRNLRTMIQA